MRDERNNISSANSESFWAKMRGTPTFFPILTIFYHVSNCSYFLKNEEKHATLMRGLSIRLFWNGIGEAHAEPEWPESFKNTTKVYSIHIELWIALPCQISTRIWKYVNLCQDFLGIPNQRMAYVKWQVWPGWTYIQRSSVTPDLLRRRKYHVLGLSICLKPEIPSFHLYMGPLVLPFFFPVCQSLPPSEDVVRHFTENAWRDCPQILHADVSWLPSNMITLWSGSVDFHPFSVSIT